MKIVPLGKCLWVERFQRSHLIECPLVEPCMDSTPTFPRRAFPQNMWLALLVAVGFAVVEIAAYAHSKLAGDIAVLLMPVWSAGIGFLLGRGLRRRPWLALGTTLSACVAGSLLNVPLLRVLNVEWNDYLNDGLFFYYMNVLAGIHGISWATAMVAAGIGAARPPKV